MGLALNKAMHEEKHSVFPSIVEEESLLLRTDAYGHHVCHIVTVFSSKISCHLWRGTKLSHLQRKHTTCSASKRVLCLDTSWLLMYFTAEALFFFFLFFLQCLSKSLLGRFDIKVHLIVTLLLNVVGNSLIFALCNMKVICLHKHGPLGLLKAFNLWFF